MVEYVAELLQHSILDFTNEVLLLIVIALYTTSEVNPYAIPY